MVDTAMPTTPLGSKLIALPQDQWEKVIRETKGLLVVFFWGPKCSDCGVFMPIFEAVAAEFEGKAKFATMDCDFRQLNSPLACGVRGTPTIIIFKDGKECERKMGPESKERLSARIKACLTDPGEGKDWK
jgi:thioredoxin 1